MERHRAGPYCRSPTAGDTLLRTEKLAAALRFLHCIADHFWPAMIRINLFFDHAAIDTALKIAD
jgi:hypothetical protein